MAKVNTISVRAELERMRLEFSQLASEGKVTPEMKVLAQSMFMFFELLVSVFMEKVTRKDTKNSSKPSSQTEKDESSESSKGSNGHGKKESEHRFSNSRTIETVEISKVSSCEQCGENLESVLCCSHERRTKIDIIFEKVVEHVDAEIKACPKCRSETKGSFPQELQGPLQYGLGIKAYLINLLIAQMVALARAQKMIQTLIGVTLSENTILNYVTQLYKALEHWELSAKERLLQASAMNCDETSLRVAQKNYWVHVYSAGKLTLKFLHSKRGNQAVDEIGIIPRYGGVIIHDCWASYFSYQNCQHALCGSHLLRELAFVVDSNGYAWAKLMKILLQRACRKVSSSNEKILNQKEYSRLQKRYDKIIAQGEKELPSIPTRGDNKRGRLAKSDAHNLWERLKKHQDAVLLFARNPNVSFTNNRAERDLRMDKVKQKVSGCFRSEEFAKAYCRISSYLATMANCGLNPLIAIELALNGKIPLEGGE